MPTQTEYYNIPEEVMLKVVERVEAGEPLEKALKEEGTKNTPPIAVQTLRKRIRSNEAIEARLKKAVKQSQIKRGLTRIGSLHPESKDKSSQVPTKPVVSASAPVSSDAPSGEAAKSTDAGSGSKDTGAPSAEPKETPKEKPKEKEKKVTSSEPTTLDQVMAFLNSETDKARASRRKARPDTQVSKDGSSATKERKFFMPNMTMILIGVGAIIVVAAIFYFIRRGQAKEKAPEKTVEKVYVVSPEMQEKKVYDETLKRLGY